MRYEYLGADGGRLSLGSTTGLLLANLVSTPIGGIPYPEISIPPSPTALGIMNRYSTHLNNLVNCEIGVI